jgi:hypothetical protein
MQGLPSREVTCAGRRLLPYVFTLLPPMAGRLFSVALSVSWAHAKMTPALNRYIALCCPDFPRRFWRRDGPALYEDLAFQLKADFESLPTETFRPRGFCVLQSIGFLKPRKPLWLASSPHALAVSRASGFLVQKATAANK